MLDKFNTLCYTIIRKREDRDAFLQADDPIETND